MEINPYAAPQSHVLQNTSADEVIRKQHINTEATIKSIGSLYYLGAFVVIIVSLSMFVSTRSESAAGALLMGVFFLALGAGQGVVAYGLRRLQGWARIPTIILSCIGLLGFPIGTLINIYILVKVLGKEGKFVMTPEY